MNKNTLNAWVGSSAKPRTAYWAATKTLVVFTAMSCIKASNVIAKGSLGGEHVAEPAMKS